MAKALMVVGSNPTSPEQEDEYHRWYVEDHFPDVLRVAGFQRARRYALSGVRPVAAVEASPYRYLALYEVEADDLAKVAADLQAAIDDGEVRMSETLDFSKFSIDFYALMPDSEVSA